MKNIASKIAAFATSKTVTHAAAIGLGASTIAIADGSDSPVIKAIAQLIAALISPGS